MATCEKNQSPREAVVPALRNRFQAMAGGWTLTTLVLIVGFVMANACLAAAGPKKLIEFGWDEPDTGFLRSNIQVMAQTPFDGCVFHADYLRTGSRGSFTWQGWGTERFSETDLAAAFADLKALRPGRFNQNFLRFNTTPAKLDWFNDYSAVLSNAGLAARLARAGACPGILFDIEQYDGSLFDYRKQRDVRTRSWDEYAAQARLRGSEVMNAFQDNYPDLTVFLTFGYSLPWSETEQGKKPLLECKYGLLAPFLDGMVQAAGDRVRLVDGYELSYGYKTASQFATARQRVTHDLLGIVQDPKKYAQVFTLGFGVWLDRDWRKRGWDPGEFSKNYFSPTEFGTSVSEALRAADEFVWIYSESPRWWGPGLTPQTKVPAEYIESLRRSRAN
jgi:hypothetical protein